MTAMFFFISRSGVDISKYNVFKLVILLSGPRCTAPFLNYPVHILGKFRVKEHLLPGGRVFKSE